MKLLHLFSGLVLAQRAVGKFFPLDKKGEIPLEIKPYEQGQEVFIDCISRNIENGEHNFDDKDKIIYVPFPNCQETGKPFSLKYGINEDINCTIGFTDELYHLFQLYIHEDAPFSCRIPLSSEPYYLEKGGAYIPLTFNFRGEIHDSHLDVDSSMNLMVTKPSNNKPEQNTVISAIAWSSSTNTTRVVIGNYLTLNFAVRWLDGLKNYGSQADTFANNGLPFSDGFYRFPLKFIAMSSSLFLTYMGLACTLTSAIVLAFSYRLLTTKISKNMYRSLDTEAGFAKQD